MAVRSPTRVRDSDNVSPLFEACKTGDLAAVRQLTTPENVNSRDLTGRKSTPLHFAAGKHKKPVALQQSGRIELSRSLRCVRSRQYNVLYMYSIGKCTMSACGV